MLKTERSASAGKVAYTNTTGSTITAGTPILVGGRVGIAANDIVNGASDELDVTGRFRAVKADEEWTAGDNIGWDSDGDPAVGTAGTGCWTTDSTAWESGFLAGIAEQDSAAGDEYGILILNTFGNVDISDSFPTGT